MTSQIPGQLRRLAAKLNSHIEAGAFNLKEVADRVKWPGNGATTLGA
jgi:hypothetical protein